MTTAPASDPEIGSKIQHLKGGDALVVKSGGVVNIEAGGAFQMLGSDCKIARGTHQQAAAQDTIVTGLATVVAFLVSPQSYTVNQQWFSGSIGDQAGSPAAGSAYINSYKATNYTNDTTPIAATTFTDNILVDWIAIGT